MTNLTHKASQKKGPPRNILQTENTLPAKIIAGSYFHYTLLKLWILLSLIPWDTLYTFGWYRSFVEFMAGIYPNIAIIPGTPSQFSEYAMGLLAFCGAIGPFFVPYYVVYGFIHVRSINLMKIKEVHFFTKLWVLIVYILFFIGLIAYSLVWNGHNFYLPNIFFESRYAFSFVTVAVWMLVSTMSFMTTAMTVGILKSFLK